MSIDVAGRRLAGEYDLLFSQFDRVYSSDHVPGSPSAWRVFRFCFGLYEARYVSRLLPEEFLSLVYKVLYGVSDRHRGLLAQFDPTRYRGRLPLAGHFLNMLKRRLCAAVRRALRRGTDRGRVGDRDRFRDRREVGLCRAGPQDVLAADPDRGADFTALTSRPDPGPDGVAGLAETVPEALTSLDPQHHRVVVLKYWKGWKDRRIGREMGLDHKTVARKHDEALAHLRRFYREEAREWGLQELPRFVPQNGQLAGICTTDWCEGVTVGVGSEPSYACAVPAQGPAYDSRFIPDSPAC